MNVHSALRLCGLVLLLSSPLSCTESAKPADGVDTDPSETDDETDQESPDDATPDAATRDAASPGKTPKPTSDSGTTKPGSTPNAQKDSGTAAPTPSGSADAAIADGGAPVADDGGTTSEPLDIPAPMMAPMVWGFGIGITDVPAALDFYTKVMKMTVEKESVKRDDSTETVLYASEAKRGSRLLLMKFDDGRNTRKITAKLVWQASNASAINSAASKYPDYKSRLNFGIVQFDGPETYVLEVGGIFDTSSGAGSISVPYPIAMGFVVSDLSASRKFYVALGMTESRTGSFGVEDATGSGDITEYTVKFAAGTGLVLQEWKPMRNAKDNPIKVVMFVPDAKAMADKVVAAGGSIAKPAERSPAYDNRLVVVAKDLDGYLLDIVE